MFKSKIIKILIIAAVNLFFLADFIIAADWILFAKENYIVYLPDDKEINNDISGSLDYDFGKRPAVTAGGSFAYGLGIDSDKTLAANLQKITGRRTYNAAGRLDGIQHILYKIQTSDFFNRPDINPEFIIYVFQSEHMRLLISDYYGSGYYSGGHHTIYNLYKIKNGSLKLRDMKITPADYIKRTEIMQDFVFNKYKRADKNKIFDIFKLYMSTIKQEIDAKYKDAKFVIIVYPPETDTEISKIEPFYTERWSELEDMGIKVLRFDTPEYDFLNSAEYKSSDDKVMPGYKAWEIIARKTADELNLRR